MKIRLLLKFQKIIWRILSVKILAIEYKDILNYSNKKVIISSVLAKIDKL